MTTTKTSISIDSKTEVELTDIKRKYGIDTTSKAIRKAVEIATKHDVQNLETNALQEIATRMQALEAKIEKLEWMITKLGK